MTQQSQLVKFSFGNSPIRFQNRDGRVWVSLTDMAKATNKRVNDYVRLEATVEFLEAYDTITGIPVMVSNVGGLPESTGTWAIEEVAIDFASWCSVKFRIWVNQQIRILMSTGKVELKTEPTIATAIETTKKLLAAYEKLEAIEIKKAEFDEAISPMKGVSKLIKVFEEDSEPIDYSEYFTVTSLIKSLHYVKTQSLVNRMSRGLAEAYFSDFGCAPKKLKVPGIYNVVNIYPLKWKVKALTLLKARKVI